MQEVRPASCHGVPAMEPHFSINGRAPVSERGLSEAPGRGLDGGRGLAAIVPASKQERGLELR